MIIMQEAIYFFISPLFLILEETPMVWSTIGVFYCFILLYLLYVLYSSQAS